jgi:hypothetical protein
MKKSLQGLHKDLTTQKKRYNATAARLTMLLLHVTGKEKLHLDLSLDRMDVFLKDLQFTMLLQHVLLHHVPI